MINLKKISQNTFIKISATNGVISVLKSVLVIITNKVVAVVVGSSGIAMIGQLQNFISITTLISSGGFNQGLTKYIAQNRDDVKSVKEYIGIVTGKQIGRAHV